jgi:hypothetical protein
VVRDERLEPAGALFLGSLDDQFEVDWKVVAERAQGNEVHEEVALAVGCTAAVPAAVHLGEAERRRAPGVLVQRGLHVVMGVEQHRGGVPVAARSRPDHRVASVGCLGEPNVVEADAGESVGHPGRRLQALLRWELARVGD